VIFTQTWLADG